MSEPLKFQEHVADAALWQWRKYELNVASRAAVQQHLQSCTACQARVQALGRLNDDMQAWHQAPQPALTEQMQLLRTLEAQFAPQENPRVLVDLSQSLVRWLAPAIAILAVVFILWREETTSTQNSLENLLSQTREEQLLMSSEDEDVQQALFELAFSSEEK